MEDLILKIVSNLGVPGLAIFLGYKLLDKYSAKIVEHFGKLSEASTSQAAAITELVSVVRQSSDGQRDVLLAVRSMSQEFSEVKGWVKEIDSRLAEPARRAVGA